MKWFLLVCSLLVLSPGAPAHGAVLSPEVQSALDAAEARGEISVILKLSGQVDVSQFSGLPKGLRREMMVASLKEKAERDQRPLEDRLKGGRDRRHASLWLINAMAVTATADVIRELADYPQVEEVRLDEVIPLLDVTYSQTTEPEWNIGAIHAKELWDIGIRGQGVVVASMDTGVDPDHPDLKSRRRGGLHSWFDPYGEHEKPFDGEGHGTGVMGVLVGGDAGGTAIGVAPRAKWIAVKIFSDAGLATSSAITSGFQWLLDPDGNPSTDDAPDVVNNSWGVNVGTCDTSFSRELKVLKAAGIAVIFAAGNTGPRPETSMGPGNLSGILSVGSVEKTLAISSFSSRGPSACGGRIFPSVVAPGAGIKSSSLSSGGQSDSYAILSGTSFAAPHVAGAMALLLSAYPGLTPEVIERAMRDSATDLGVAGPDNGYGYGLIDVARAYSLIKSRTITRIFTSQSNLDGWIKEASEGSGLGGYVNGASDLLVGDDACNRRMKGILSFNTESIPDSALVTSAVLSLTRKRVFRTPFCTLKPLYVDIACGSFLVSALQRGDFQARATVDRVAAAPYPGPVDAVSRVRFTEPALKAINAFGLTQVRVYFSRPTNSNRLMDAVEFFGDGSLTSQRPKLRVTYILP